MKRQCRPKKTWDELFRNGRKKMELINHPENRSEQTGAFARKTCQPSDEENGLYTGYNDSMVIKLDSCFQTFSNHIHVRYIKFLSHLTVMSPQCPACTLLVYRQTLFSLHLHNLMAENWYIYPEYD